MRRIRRNAFALGKKQEAMASPSPDVPSPQYSHDQVMFGMVSPPPEDVQYEYSASERNTPCPSLTDEQVTGTE